MASSESSRPTAGSGKADRDSLDQFLTRLPESKRKAHRWLQWLMLVFFVVVVAAFGYAIYTSVIWPQVGESDVVAAWTIYFLACAPALLAFGIDILLLRAVIPPPFGRAPMRYQTGPMPVVLGWILVVAAVVLAVLATWALAAVNAGRMGLGDWIGIVVGVTVGLGLVSAAVQIVRRVARPAP